MSESARCEAVKAGLEELWKLLSARRSIVGGWLDTAGPIADWVRESPIGGGFMVRRGPLWITSPKAGFVSQGIHVVEPERRDCTWPEGRFEPDYAIGVSLNDEGPWIDYLERELPLMLGELDAAWQALYSPPMSEEKRVSIRRRAEEIVREALEGPEEGEIDVAAPGNPIEEKTDCCVVEAFMDLKREDGSAAKVREVKARVDDGSVCGQLMHLLLSNLGLEALLEEDGE